MAAKQEYDVTSEARGYGVSRRTLLKGTAAALIFKSLGGEAFAQGFEPPTYNGRPPFELAPVDFSAEQNVELLSVTHEFINRGYALKPGGLSFDRDQPTFRYINNMNNTESTLGLFVSGNQRFIVIVYHRPDGNIHGVQIGTQSIVHEPDFGVITGPGLVVSEVPNNPISSGTLVGASYEDLEAITRAVFNVPPVLTWEHGGFEYRSISDRMHHTTKSVTGRGNDEYNRFYVTGTDEITGPMLEVVYPQR